ncbi:MAG: TIM barrel protein, partial [Anaerolineales bacterium]|nr:TIM barrel protein [Anaerolineales bacterium]
AKEDEWPKSRQRIVDAAYYGNLAGATDIIFHPGSYFQRPPDEVLPKVIPRLQDLMDELAKDGNPVRLRPETMGKSAMLGSLDDVLVMSRELPGLEPCIDFPHLYARPGDGSINNYEDWSQLLERYGKSLGDEALQRLHIHLSGIEYGPKGEKKHLPIAESGFDLDAVLKALKNFGCGGRMLIESPPLEDDAILVKERWENL